MHTLYYAYTLLCIHCTRHTLYYAYIVLCIHCTMHTLYYAYIVLYIHCTMLTLYYTYIVYIHNSIAIVRLMYEYYFTLLNAICSLNSSKHLYTIHPSIRASINQCIHPSMHPCIHQCIHQCIHPSMHPCIHQCIHPKNLNKTKEKTRTTGCGEIKQSGRSRGG